ncbi:MAG: MurT ligase domain-containing protein [Oryzihumus sp.]
MSANALFHRTTESPGSHAPERVGARVRASCLLGRAVSTLSRATGRGAGEVIGGRVILALAPDAPRRLAVGHDVALVSGTNGKTTTTRMLAAALGALGPVDSNSTGANTGAGFVTALAGSHAERVVLETDEGWLPWAVARVAPSTVVLLNLSRDQLSRHHEVAHLATSWRGALDGVETVVANSDDPDTVWPALAARHQVWVAAGQRWTEDSGTCPSCGAQCVRDETGWSCTCGLRSPAPHWWLEGDDLVSADVRVPLELSLPGDYNRANAAMAVAAAVTRGVDPAAAVARLRDIDAVEGRYAWQEVGAHRVRLLLAKNPAGWLEIVDLVRDTGTPLVLSFNSEGVDGRDPSWLYDVSFRDLADRPIVVTGRRATDMRVRLEMDGLTPTVVRGGLREALATLPAGDVDVLANYTAFRDAHRELSHADRH